MHVCGAMRVFTHALTHARTQARTYVFASRANYLISNIGVKTTLARTMGSDSRMRADELPSSHRESQGMLQYTRVGTSRTRVPRTAPPSESLLLLRFNEMLRPLARDYFPIAPINSLFGRSRLSRRDSGTPFLPDGPWGYGFHRASHSRLL